VDHAPNTLEERDELLGLGPLLLAVLDGGAPEAVVELNRLDGLLLLLAKGRERMCSAEGGRKKSRMRG
jgi:hypothetical protein